jgi:hypothetical protein
MLQVLCYLGGCLTLTRILLSGLGRVSACQSQQAPTLLLFICMQACVLILPAGCATLNVGWHACWHAEE